VLSASVRQGDIALAVLGLAAALTLAGIVIRRAREAVRETARRDRVEAGLRDELARLAAEVTRTAATNRSRSHFFAQVTHELRTPLNAILGFSETIRQEMFGPVANPRYRDYAGLIHDAGTHLLSLINDLLDSARIEAGKMEIAPLRVSATALARSALDLVELSAETRGVGLHTAGLDTCPDLNVDPRAFKQVLVNLLSNAIKFTPPGGHVAIAFAVRDDGGLAITITDTGIGMSAEEVRLAFEPFGRGGGGRARVQEGSGLGLSLARGLVRLHDGELLLSSRLDAGTTATITLPASAAFGAGDEAASVAEAA
jgi:signal transduction histidine kinase